jgi:hypothetical protein
MLVQNKGYAAMLQLMRSIKKLKQFNAELGIRLMQNAPEVRENI